MKVSKKNQLTTKQKMISLTLVAIIGFSVSAFAGYNIGYDHGTKKNINTFEECAAAGYPVQESYPERCSLPGGRSFTKDISQSGSTTFEGRVVCLPHHDMDSPHTLECAIGLQTAGSDKRVRIEGTLKEEASTTYQSIGTITVTKFEFIQ